MKPGPILRKTTIWGLVCFCLANAALGLFVFRDALWGGSLLAPLDIAPACFGHYRFVDPASNGVIASNAQFDQVVYDLPLQHGIYQSYRRGEIPWWDPYGFGGRPLLADAHINGTDPVRLLAYAAFPFELAYNWTRVCHFFLTGLTLFTLLSYWRFSPWIAVLLSLTFEFAGSFSFFFGFPWLHGSVLYYPLLWLSWDAAVRTGHAKWGALAALAIAGIFYAGNLQSHSYVVLFAGAFVIGYAGREWRVWCRIIPLLLLSGVAGACLAAPVLTNQIEFFLEGVRGVKPALSSRVYLLGLTTLTSIYPWMLGDFRTIDARNAFFQALGFGQNYGLGFHTYIGSAGLVLASIGAFRGGATEGRGPIRRTALALCILFLLIVSSPFIAVFYTRLAGLFVLGAIVLAAIALQVLGERAGQFRALGWFIALAMLAIAILTNAGAFFVYPRLLPRVRQIMLDRDSSTAPGAVFKMPLAYRSFQLSNLPNEVSFKNPEALIAALGLFYLACLLIRPALRSATFVMPGLLLLNLAPPVLFAARFVPRAPVVLW